MSYTTPPNSSGSQGPSGPAGSSGAGKKGASDKRGRVLIPTLVVLAVLAVLVSIFAGFFTDFLWFDSFDATSVFTTQLVIKVGLFLAFGFLMAIVLGVAMMVAYRFAPSEAPRTQEQLSLARYRQSLETIRKPLFFIIPAVIGLVAGIAAASEWRSWSMWRNQVPFGEDDPQFGQDIGFYMFSYPWIRFIVGFLFAIVVLAFILMAFVNYIYGAIRLQPPGPRVSNAAQVQLSILLGLFCLLKAVSYWLDRYSLALKSEDLAGGFTGLTYRDIHAVLPAKQILMVIALICAALLFFNAFRRSWPIAGSAIGLLVLSAIIIGGIYPAIVQQFQVNPSELTRESPSIKTNIDATRKAFDLNRIKKSEYNAKATPDRTVLNTQMGTLGNVRLVDPTVVSPTFRALQQIRSFYSFPNELDVDRYMIDGKQRGAIVATREVNLDGVAEDQRNWANDHLVYTHGYGFVAANDNAKQNNGNPVFFEQDIPPKGDLKITEPRVYFGEDSPNYSIVGGDLENPRELDFPDDSAPDGQRNNTYSGDGGAEMGSAFRRAMFALKFQDPNIMLSSLINSDSKILWDRDPKTIVSKMAPWLTLDEDPYPIVVDGRIKWIVDGYTSSSNYPFSSRTSLAEASGDSQASASAGVNPRNQLNYIRNSVKAVVDAFDGTTNLYAWDESDPILKTWQNVFPGVVKAKSEIPAAELAHVRYPEDVFSLQRQMFSRYHVTEPSAFYNGQDFWVVPTDPTKEGQTLKQPPYYLQLQMPKDPKLAFSLTTTFAPINRPTLAAFMSVDSTPDERYGNFEVLQLPRNTTIPGPQQVQNNFESNPDVANQLTLLRRGSAQVELGNLLSLPVGDGILYVEPVYVKASQDGYPLLQRVLVGFGEKVALEETLAEGLAKVGVVPAKGGVIPQPDNGGNDKKDDKPSTKSLQDQLTDALNEIDRAFAAGEKALREGDFAAYGKAQQDLNAAIRKAREIQAKIKAGS